nr:valine--tRNA ligase [bacterium]
GREIPIVADEYVEKDFGSGAVKITPAHDPNDYEVALRHDLPVIQVIDEGGIMNENAGEYAGMDRFACRKAVVQALEETGALVRVEEYSHNVGHCYRCGTVVEPTLSLQWFVSMAPLAKPAIEAVKNGDVKFVPERFEKVYFNWMENIKDWCISRQLWWGHRIPAWYCDCGHMVVAREAPECCPKCGGAMKQDEDVLDTWFSSALWPFSTMGWPDDTPEMRYFYPTTALVTGYDIIFFWVARMIFSGLEYTGKAPFSDVIIHGLVRDSQGRKMSKSLGNGIDPLEVIEKYGADALRFSLIMGNAPGNDMRFYWEKVESARNFANKIWNAARFMLQGAPEVRPAWREQDLLLPEKWILHRYKKVVESATAHMETYEFGMAASEVYDFIWSQLCDWYIELAKPALYGEDEARKATVQAVLFDVLEGVLKLLHPFMPFLTEAVYQALPGAEDTIMYAPWPDAQKLPEDEASAQAMEDVMDLVRAIRNLRAQLGVAPSRQAPAYVLPAPGHEEAFRCGMPFVTRLAGISEVHFIQEAADRGMAVAVSEAAQGFLPMAELVDIEKETARLMREKQQADADLQRCRTKLGNENFVSRANPRVVEEERQRLARLEGMLVALDEQLAALQALKQEA